MEDIRENIKKTRSKKSEFKVIIKDKEKLAKRLTLEVRRLLRGF